MGVNYFILVLPKKSNDFFLICRKMRVLRHNINPSTESLDLFSLRYRRAFQCKEIKLNLCPINVSVVVHNYHFHTAVVHISHHLRNSYRFCHAIPFDLDAFITVLHFSSGRSLRF